MHGNLLNKNKSKMFLTANSDLAARISILENNVYKITYYEIISGASGTLTVPTAATINADEFSGADCILSEIDVNNKPTWVSPKTVGGTVVTATLNTSTGAWVKSGVTASANVALIYSLNIRAADYANLTNFYIIEETVIGDLTYVLNNTTVNSVASSLLAGVISDETGSGSLVFGTSPTFTTDITTPLIIGGSAVGSTIQYKGTSGNGTSTVAAHQFLVGNNGATTATSIYNSGQVNIGNYATPSAQRLVTIGEGSAWVSIGEGAGALSGFGAIYINQATPSTSNYTLIATSSSTVLNAVTSLGIYVNGVAKTTYTTTTQTHSFSVATSGAVTPYTITIPANTGQTASTEIPNFKITGNTKTWATGAITTQRWNYITANTADFIGLSTITNSYGLYVEKATAGTNATITNNFSLGTDGDVQFGGQYLYLGGNSGASGFTLRGTASDLEINTPTQNAYIYFRLGTSNRMIIGRNNTTGAVSAFEYLPNSNTGQTASTEIPGYLYNSYSRQWATGAITTQRERYYKTVTYTAVGASTITTAYGAYFEAPTASTNITITNNYAAGFSGDLYIASGSSTMYLGQAAAGVGALWLNSAAKATTNPTIAADSSNTIIRGITSLIQRIGNTTYLTLTANTLTFADSTNIALNTTTGTKIGTATTEKLAFWNATPIVQPTTAVAAATLVGGGGTTLTDTDTFDGYTLKQIVKALRNTGLLA